MKKLTLTLGLLMALLLPAVAVAESVESSIPFNATTVSNILDKNGAAVTTVTADTEISYFELTDPMTKLVFKFNLDKGENVATAGPFYPKYITATPNLRVYYGNTVTITAPEGVTITSLGTSNSSTATAADKAAAQWASVPEGQNNSALSDTPWNWSGSANEITFKITALSGRNKPEMANGQGIISFNLSYEGDFVYDKYADHTFVIKSITPADFSKNSSFNIQVGNGSAPFVPVFTFGRQKLDSSGNVLSEVELAPNTISKNPYCYDNANLQDSRNSTPDYWGDNSADPNLNIIINADNTANINIKTKNLIWQTPGRYIIIEIPANYFRALKVDGTYETFPASKTKYVYHVNPAVLTPIQVTLPSGSDKKLRFSMEGRINPSGVDYRLVIQDAADVVLERIFTPTIEGNDVVFDMSNYKSGDYKYTLTDGSLAWQDADGGIYINEGVSGQILGFEGASYFDTFDLSINGYTKNEYGRYNDVQVGTVYSGGQRVGIGEFVLTVPEGFAVEAGEGTAELLRYDNNTWKYVSFPTPITWNASDIVIDKDGEGNALNVARLAGPSVADVYSYEGFQLIVPAGFVKSGSLSNEAADLYVNVTKTPVVDMFTIAEDETDDGKYAILTPKSQTYNFENLQFLPGMEISGYSTAVTTDDLVDVDGSIKIDKLITESTLVSISASSVAAVDANGNWKFNKIASKTITCDFKVFNGFRYEDTAKAPYYDECRITRIMPEAVKDGVVVFPNLAMVTDNWGYKVTEIAANAFKNCDNVTSVILNENMATIKADAFKGAENLKTVYMQKVPAVTNGAFNGVPEDCKIYVPATANVTALGGRAVEKVNMVFETSTSATLEDGYTYLSFTEKDLPVTYNRNFSGFENTWQVLFVPHAMEAGSLNGKVAQLSRVYVENGTRFVEWKVVNGTLDANKPYLFKPAAGGTHAMKGNGVVSHTNVGSATEECDDFEITLTGVYTAQPVSVGDGKYYMYSDGNFHPAGVASILKPFRVFLTITDKNSANNASVLYNVLNDGTDTPTAIGELPVEVLKSDVYYDLQGREVQNPERGIYILNGRKVVIK